MKSYRSKVFVVSIVLMLLLALAACGGQETTEPVAEATAVPAVEEAVEEPTAAPEEPVAEVEEAPAATEEAPAEAEASTAENALVLWVYDDGRVGVLTELGKQFEEEYGIPVVIEVVDLGEIKNQMLLGAGTGEGPDMAIIPHDNLGPLVENGAVAVVDLEAKEDQYL
ncbi:MAG: extracellular solute-binding protein, partial [Anaerolineae bacterium]|nr:extracellular solute-binding protein [Anaerolineae bacterium]